MSRETVLANRHLRVPVLTAQGHSWIASLCGWYDGLKQAMDDGYLDDRIDGLVDLIREEALNAVEALSDDTVWDVYHGISAWSTTCSIDGALRELQESLDPTDFGRTVLEEIAYWMLATLFLTEGDPT